MLYINQNNKHTEGMRSYFMVSFVVFLILISTFRLTAQENKTVIAKRGEGIYAILRDNNLPFSSINEFILINKEKLDKNEQLIEGKEYILPTTDSTKTAVHADTIPVSTIIADTISEPLLGKKYEHVIRTNPLLKNAVIYLDAGHGGPDPGATARYQNVTLCEDEYAYDITLRLYHNLIALGATTYLITRDKNDGIRDQWHLEPDWDETCYPDTTIPLNPKERLKQRTEVINRLYKIHNGQYQRLIIIHVDSRSQSEKIDVFFYADPRSKKGKKFAANLRDIFDRKYRRHQPGRGYNGSVLERELYLLQNTIPVATFIELGNIQHEHDLKRFIIKDNRQALANWLTEGIIVDFKENNTSRDEKE